MSGTNALGTQSNPFQASAPTPGGDPDVVGITVGKSSLYGWQEVRITRGIESFPSSFDIALTERYPTTPTQIAIQPGAPCKVTIGRDTVVTGYVDRYTSRIGPNQHEVHIVGRGMGEDLVDCSAMFATYQTQNSTLVSLARKLAAPFGITVKPPMDGSDSAPTPQFNVILTETPYEIIERVARWSNYLAYEDTDGALVISKVGDTSMASGFAQGGNVETGDVSFSMDERYTEMHSLWLSTAFLNDPPPELGSSGPVLPFIKGADATDTSFPARADGTPRKRPFLVVSEQTSASADLAAQRTRWDNARRIGRSQRVTLTCDSWRDLAGALWRPNAKATLNLPALKLVNQTWLISEVVFERDERGTHAHVTLMPPAAFVPALDNLVPFDWQLAQDLPNGGANNYAPAQR